MNKNNLRSFAISARNILIERVQQKAYELGITEDKVKKAQIESSDAVYINGKSLDKIQIKQRSSLIDQIKSRSYSQVIEEVAYTWFNRFCALRYMEVNNYLPTGIRVLSSTQAGNVEPDILREALHLTEDLDLDPGLVFELRERKDNNDLFKYLLIKQCNSLNLLLPFLFEKVEDYTEILFPDNLLKEGSILRTMVNTNYIPEADWQDVEIIGWLYQYYISEKKDQVFADLKKNIKISPENIPAATQLFTPHWIVRYLVENSLGRLWMLNHPDSRLIELMDYYIKPVDTEVDFLKISSPEEIKICDPACGSGHMLTYAFDLLYAIYEESGYVGREIPALILRNNLYGIEIDQRAGQLAALALSAKARSQNNNFFRKPVQPHICTLQNIHFDKDELKQYIDEVEKGLLSTKLLPTLRQFEEATNFGSLIIPDITDVNDTLTKLQAYKLTNNMFLEATHKKIIQALKQVQYLIPIYHVVVANPPYMGNVGMNIKLKASTEKKYPDSKTDLFAMFIERNLALVLKQGFVSMVTMQSWMFLSSYERLRAKILENANITTLVQIGYNSFPELNSKVAQACAFVLEKSPKNAIGLYINLNNAPQSSDKEQVFIQKRHLGEVSVVSRSVIKKIPGKVIAYWLSKKALSIYDNSKPLSSIADPKQGCATSDNNRFLRLWFEVNIRKVSFNCVNTEDALESGYKWFPYNKGGAYRKWYGNQDYIINWEYDGKEIKDEVATKYPYLNGNIDYVVKNRDFYFKESLSWSKVTSSGFALRYFPSGFIFDVSGCSIFCNNDYQMIILGVMNSYIMSKIINTLSPTLNFEVGQVAEFPISDILINKPIIDKDIWLNLIRLSRTDWDSFETSWNFVRMPLLNNYPHSKLLLETYNSLHIQWQNTTSETKRLEEENNRIFIDAYNLQDEIIPDVPFKEITLNCNPFYRYDSNKTGEELAALLLTDTVKEYVSYAVGCMFGRYSLDKEGLIFAGGVFDPYQYPAFPADPDNVIPVLADDYFKDDIVARFVEFVKITFSQENLDENLDFIAEALGRKSSETARDTIRRYFINDFYKDHVQLYKKRPIYWMFTSGKEKAFNCLVYLHRYQPDTVATLRTEYLHRLQEAMEIERKNLQRTMKEEAGSPVARNANKRLFNLEKQIQELAKYDELVHHYADMRISLDLDDGVKVNYAKLQELLAKI